MPMPKPMPKPKPARAMAKAKPRKAMSAPKTIKPKGKANSKAVQQGDENEREAFRANPKNNAKYTAKEVKAYNKKLKLPSGGFYAINTPPQVRSSMRAGGKGK